MDDPKPFDSRYEIAYPLIVKKGAAITQEYWVKCLALNEMKNPKAIMMNNKKHATSGTCLT
jgi:hypothetical protein